MCTISATTVLKVIKKEMKEYKPIKTRRIALHGSKDKESAKEGGETTVGPRKRRWGSTRSKTDTPSKTTVNISTDMLKEIMPEIVTNPDNVAIDMYDDQDDIEKPTEASEESPAKLRRVITQVVASDEEMDKTTETIVEEESETKKDDDEEEGTVDNDDSSDSDSDSSEDDEGEDESDDESKNDEKKKDTKLEKEESNTEKSKPETKENEPPSKSLIRPQVRVSIDEPITVNNKPAQSRRPRSEIIHIRNLVRPYTINQLKELLQRSGKLVADGFWIDNIKSHCYATYGSKEEAEAARDALHGKKWPSSNPKVLHVEYAAESELLRSKGVQIPKPERDEKQEAEKNELRQQREKARQERLKEKESRDRKRDVTSRDSRHEERPRRSTSHDRRRRDRSEERRSRHKVKTPEPEEPPAKLLDDLFRKTKATPCIYWLPLTPEQIVLKDKEKEQRRLDREERLKKMQEKNEEERKQQELRIEKRRREQEKERERRSGGGSSRRSRSRSKGRRR